MLETANAPHKGEPAVSPAALQTLVELTTLNELDGEPQWQTDPYLRAVVSLPLRLER